VFSLKNYKRLRFAQHTSNGGKSPITTRSQKAKINRAQINPAPEESKVVLLDLRTINLYPLTRRAQGSVLSENGGAGRDGSRAHGA
jgi:hypothetical protein